MKFNKKNLGLMSMAWIFASAGVTVLAYAEEGPVTAFAAFLLMVAVGFVLLNKINLFNKFSEEFDKEAAEFDKEFEDFDKRFSHFNDLFD